MFVCLWCISATCSACAVGSFVCFTIISKDPLFITRGTTIPAACAPHDTLTLYRHCLYVYGVSPLHAVHRFMFFFTFYCDWKRSFIHYKRYYNPSCMCTAWWCDDTQQTLFACLVYQHCMQCTGWFFFTFCCDWERSIVFLKRYNNPSCMCTAWWADTLYTLFTLFECVYCVSALHALHRLVVSYFLL